MPQRDPGVYLEDIEHYAAAAVRFTSGFSLEQYLADEKTRAAVERVLEVCGEAMTNLYRVAPTVAETIPHARDIIGFRNILAPRGLARHSRLTRPSSVDCARRATETLRGHQGLVGPSFSGSGCRTLRSMMCASLRMRLISSSQW
jgi:uncharacterized protein with HEPN domain